MWPETSLKIQHTFLRLSQCASPEAAPVDLRAELPDVSGDSWCISWYKKPHPDTLAAWAELSDEQSDVFLSPAYLELMQHAPPEGVQTGVAIFARGGVPVFGVVTQLLWFSAKQQLALSSTEGKRWAQWQQQLQQGVASWLQCRVLIAGQLLATGGHAVQGAANLPDDELAAVLAKGLERIAQHLDGQGERIVALSAKDLGVSTPATWRAQGYFPLPVQPNMVLHLDPAWQHMTDYLGAMSSKYRVRAKRARKKADGLVRRELSLDEIQQQEAVLMLRYHAVITGADFNAARVHAHYFSGLKAAFPDQFRLWAYYDGDTLAGFCTTLVHGSEMDAHFIGFDAAYNHSHQLYLNMLYDMVGEAIAARVSTLVFARTALEIKSSVGAQGIDSPCYLRLRRPVLHWAAPCLTQWLSPLPDWTPRHPFRHDEEA